MATREDEYHASKRQRTDDGNGLQSSSSRAGGYDHDPHKPAQSPVIHMRGLSDYATRQDIWECCEKFGRVAEVMLMSKKKQALVEFEDIQDAISCINYSKSAQIYVAGSSAGFNFSTSQRIQRDKLASNRDLTNVNSSSQVNNILLFTILEPIHPITIEVMKTICSSFGKVLRVVIFRKSGVQSMVEFEDTESAKNALAGLQGQDIYTNCCTLRIEYAKATRLNVRRNDPMESWDFTVINDPEPTRRSRPLLADPHYNEGPSRYSDSPRGGYGMSSLASSFHDMAPSAIKRDSDLYARSPPAISDYNSGRDFRESIRGGDRYPPSEIETYSRYSDRGPSRSMRDEGYEGRGRGPMIPDNNMYSTGRSGMSDSMPSVLMIYGLNMEQMNCHKLFNLLCLYGNVNRIKFLMKKEGTAMVELGDCLSVERAIQNLNNVTFYNSKMQATKSKQTNVQEVMNPHKLPDGSSSYEDYSRSRNNRYTNARSAEKNRIQSPSPVLHYFNAPPEMSDSDLKELFKNLGCATPIKTKKFPQKSDRSSSGLIQFESASAAVEGLVSANHNDVEAPNGRTPFIFKLCFSSNQNLE